MNPFVKSRKIPAEASTYSLVGRTHYSAPILALSNTVYQVKGTVAFTPGPNAEYVIRGVLGEKYSSVWLEEKASKKLVGKKIEVKGSAKLGLFQK